MYNLRAVILALCVCAASAQGCDRALTPALDTSEDALYTLTIAGDPTDFEQGELYTVLLKGVESEGDRKTFSGFIVWSETESDGNQTKTSNPGSFQTDDTQSKLDDNCPGTLVNSTELTKSEIQVIWNAPLTGTECVRLIARVGEASKALEDWSILEHKICPAEHKIYGSQPPIIDPCCACDEAKYEVTFEGLWSRNTHPKDFPADERITRYSDVIGASHTVHYRFWQVGRVASQGLRELAEEGHTTTLEKELKAESDNIRTIIKARGMSWPRLGGATFAVFRVDARRHLVSLVSRLSPSPDWVVGVSALELCQTNCTWLESDSIDLFPYDAGTDSGITYMSRRQRTVPSGPVRALRPDWPRDPRSPFYEPSGAAMKPFARMRLTRQRLYEKSCDPQGGTPDREHGSAGSGVIMSPEREQWGVCATGAWGMWGACSVTCGVGGSLRQRYYLEPARAEALSCRRALTERKKCRGARMHCRAPSEYEPDPALTASGSCAISQWSEWSPCSARECETGVRVRTRRYHHRSAYKRCHHGWRTKPSMDQTIECFGDSVNCTFPDADTTEMPTTELTMLDPDSLEANSTNITFVFEDVSIPTCAVSPWGSWSTCSARCGRGWRMRTRLYLAPAYPAPSPDPELDSRAVPGSILELNPRPVPGSVPGQNPRPVHRSDQGPYHRPVPGSVPGPIPRPARRRIASVPRPDPHPPRYIARLQHRLTKHLTDVWNRRYAAWQNIEIPEYNLTDTEDEIENEFRQQLELCEMTLTMQDAECEGDDDTCHTSRDPAEVCGLKLAVGACRGYSERWFYDAVGGACEPFAYTGCRGNANNFPTRDHCLRYCANFTVAPVKKTQEPLSKMKWVPGPAQSASNNDVIQNDGTQDIYVSGGVPVDCTVGPWSGWSECAGNCHTAVKLNYRLVIRQPENGGRACPESLLKSRRCRMSKCHHIQD